MVESLHLLHLLPGNIHERHAERINRATASHTVTEILGDGLRMSPDVFLKYSCTFGIFAFVLFLGIVLVGTLHSELFGSEPLGTSRRATSLYMLYCSQPVYTFADLKKNEDVCEIPKNDPIFGQHIPKKT